MATYKILCVTRSGDDPHDHVVSVGIGPTTNVPVAKVREALDHADTYYVFGGDLPAVVEKFDCDCGAETIRSAAGAIEANNLDSVASC